MKQQPPGYHLDMRDEPQSVSDRIESNVDPNVSEMIVSPPHARMRARWAWTVLLVVLGVYAVLAVLANRYAYFKWDLALARRIQSVSIPGLGMVMTAVSLLGSGLVAWPLVIITGFALVRSGLRAEGVVCMSGAAAGSLVNRLLKLIIARPRPSDVLVHVARVYQHESFPSGHVVFFVEFFGFLFFLAYVLLKPRLLRPALLFVLAVLIVMVGVSRVYLGAHWPSDAVGAYLVGGAWLMLMIAVYRRIKAG